MSERVPGLDLLRAAAISCVVLTHGLMFLGKHYPGLVYLGHFGSVGVDLFFVLSGFLIGGILWRTGNELRSGRALVGFWLRRWLRTLPNYYFFLCVAVILLLATRPQAIDWSHRVLPTALFVQNLTDRGTPFFPESWTLAVEEWFYVLLPAALWLGLRVTSDFRRVWWVTVTAMVVLPFVARCFAPVPSSWGWDVRMPVIFRLDAIAHGVAMAGLAAQFPARISRLRVPMALLGLALVAAGYVSYYAIDLDHSKFARTALMNLFSAGFALWMVWAAALPSLGPAWFESGVRAIARWSYSLYLCNFGLYLLITRLWGRQIATSPPLALAASFAFLVGSLVIAILAYYFVEQPGMRLRDRLPSARSAPSAQLSPTA